METGKLRPEKCTFSLAFTTPLFVGIVLGKLLAHAKCQTHYILCPVVVFFACPLWWFCSCFECQIVVVSPPCCRRTPFCMGAELTDRNSGWGLRFSGSNFVPSCSLREEIWQLANIPGCVHCYASPHTKETRARTAGAAIIAHARSSCCSRRI